MGAAGAEGAETAAAATRAGVAGACAGAGATVGLAAAPAVSEITATTAPTGATAPTATRISASTPVVVEGTSIETLSVSISNRLSPGLTGSPAALNHLVILPSETVSPSSRLLTPIRLTSSTKHIGSRGTP